MWKLNNNLYLSYKKSNFLFLTTTKYLLPKQPSNEEINKISALPYISKEKTYCFKKLLEIFEIKQKVILLAEQVHGNKVVYVDNLKENELDTFLLDTDLKKLYLYKYKLFPSVDGIITSNHKFVVLIFTADCVPLFIYDTKSSIFGLVHIGRKGLENGVLNNLMELLLRQNVSTDNIRFLVGPHICEKCYIVEGKNYSLLKNLIFQLSLYKITKTQIKHIPLCTYHNEDLFFSYRKNHTPWRLLSLITSKK